MSYTKILYYKYKVVGYNIYESDRLSAKKKLLSAN